MRDISIEIINGVVLTDRTRANQRRGALTKSFRNSKLHIRATMLLKIKGNFWKATILLKTIGDLTDASASGSVGAILAESGREMSAGSWRYNANKLTFPDP